MLPKYIKKRIPKQDSLLTLYVSTDCLAQGLYSLISSRFDIRLLVPIEKLQFFIVMMLSSELMDLRSCCWTSENFPKLSTILNASRNSLKSILPSWFRSILRAISDIWSNGQFIFCCFTRSWITSSNSSMEIWPVKIISLSNVKVFFLYILQFSFFYSKMFWIFKIKWIKCINLIQ